MKYKNKKFCFTTLNSLKNEHGIVPGTLLKIVDDTYFPNFSNKFFGHVVIDNGMPKTTPNDWGNDRWTRIEAGELVVFLDLVFDPKNRNFGFIFLHKERMYMLVFPAYSKKPVKFFKKVFSKSFFKN